MWCSIQNTPTHRSINSYKIVASTKYYPSDVTNDRVNRKGWRNEQWRHLERNCVKALQEGGERGRGQLSPLSQELTSLSQLANGGLSQWSYSLEKAHRWPYRFQQHWGCYRGARVERQPMLDMAKDKCCPWILGQRLKSEAHKELIMSNVWKQHTDEMLPGSQWNDLTDFQSRICTVWLSTVDHQLSMSVCMCVLVTHLVIWADRQKSSSRLT